MHVLIRSVGIFLLASLVLLVPAHAQSELGCCQFVSRPTHGTAGGGRRCDNLTKEECSLTRPVSTFFRGQQCDVADNRCVAGVPPPPTPIPTSTPTRMATPTASPTALPGGGLGCCQVENISRPPHPACGNAVGQDSCERDFGGTFCPTCTCSSHSGPGFDVAAGTCSVPPPPTATPSVGPIGCCQLDNLHRLPYPVCGNAISESSCLNDYAGTASFCANCACTSHTDPGFELSAGECVVPATPTPTPVPPLLRGCCQLDGIAGLSFSVCGNDIAQADCDSQVADEPTFCATCTCSSHADAGFTFANGTCAARPVRPHPPHQPHPTH